MDISQIAYYGGVPTYTRNLAQELVKDTELEMVYFYTSLRKPYQGNLPGVKSFKIPPTIAEFLFNRLRVVPIEKFIGEVDVYHSSDWMQPPTKAKKVTTYHDVVPLKYPQWSTTKIIDVHKRRLKLVEKEIDHIIAVSSCTKQNLVELADIPEEKITVVYEAAGEQFKPQPHGKVDKFRKKWQLPEQFVLAIGGVGERRNLGRVKEASRGYRLVITGETFPWLSDEELPLLYSSASALLYPSLYEGFGLPILEAFACGTPVITAQTSSIPEVGGHGVLYTDAEDVRDIRNKLRLVLEDSKLRKKMISEGFKQASKFSWEKCARETAEVYKKVFIR